MEAPHTTDAPPSRLPRELGLFSAVAVLIGSTIGSGIFRSPAGIADKLPGPLPLLSVWLFGGIFVLCGALTLAEVASAFPATGGLYVFIREAWGRRAAFLFGWSELLLIRAASLGAISTTFAEYLFRVLGHEPSAEPYATYVHWVAALAIALTATFNYVGLKWGSLVQNLTTVAKYGGLLFIVLVAIALGLPHTGGHFTPAVPPGSFSLAPFGLALISVLWAYDGWEDVSLVGGEVKDGRRTLPRAIIIGTVAVIAIYALANLAYLSVLDVETIRHSRLVAADVAFKVIGSPGVVFVAVTVMLSTFGTLNGSIMTAPRIFFAMADDRLLFKQIAKVHPRYTDAVRRDHSQRRDRRGVRAHARLRAARRPVRDRDRAISGARSGRGVRAPPPSGLRHVVPRAWISGGAAHLHRLDHRAPAERADRQVEPHGDARCVPRNCARASDLRVHHAAHGVEWWGDSGRTGSGESVKARTPSR